MQAPVDILLVDDERRNLDALEVILADPAYRLLRAENADRALRLLLENRVAAIVLDIKMPGMSGFELAQTIKSTKRFRETPIVFLTAHMVEDKDVVAGYGAGGVDYLTKPVNPEILRHKVAVFADLYRKTRELAELNERLGELNDNLEERVRERTAELERSEAALRAADRQKDEFIAILAHELRNPLAPIRTGLDILLRFYGTSAVPAPIERTLGAMNRQLNHIVRLIDDLLDVSRVSRGLVELKLTSVDLGSIAQTAVDNLRPAFEKRGQVVTLQVAEPLRAHADPTRLSQILANLLHNASKFTPAGGSIRVELAREDDRAVFKVIDSGAGIPPGQIERVFDMFSRIAPPGVSEPGLGIGLALGRRLAVMHGGTLEGFSEGDGRGTTFTLRIPLSREARAPEAAPTNGAPCSDASAAPLDIVVVEDNQDIAATLMDWLQALGHRVSAATTGTSGLELIRQSAPALVLCDLGLPEMDGLDVCRHVRQLPAMEQPVMVALTGWGRTDDRGRTRDAGFDHHLVKPVDPDSLQEVLRAVAEARLHRSSASDILHGGS